MKVIVSNRINRERIEIFSKRGNFNDFRLEFLYRLFNIRKKEVIRKNEFVDE